MASKMAVRTAVNYLIEVAAGSRSTMIWGPPTDYDNWLQQAVIHANDLVYECNQRNNGHLATTLLLALVVGNSAYIANIGDSRAYLVSGRDMRLLSTDHSVTQKLLGMQLINAEEARHHPQSNVLTQAVGSRAMVAEQHVHTVLAADEYLLLCSDGLYKELEEAEIQAIIYRSHSAQAACDNLLQAANHAGGRDNIAVTLLRLQTTVH
jgi:protein phosphatase